MRKLLFSVFLLICQSTISQTPFQTTFGPGNWKALVTIPDVYNSNPTDSFPCIIFIPGAGEIGGGYAALDDYGPHARIIGGWDGGIDVAAGKVYPVIISLEPNTDFATNGEFTRIVLDTILNRYSRIKRNSLHVTGFSAGAFAWKILVTKDATDETPPYGPFTYADYPKSIFDLQGVQPDDNPNWLTSPKNFARNKWGGKYLGFWGTADGIRQMDRFKDTMNAAVPGSALLYSTTDGHNTTAWNRFYGSTGGATPEAFNIGGVWQDVYQWMIRQGDTTVFDSPVEVDAGPNRVLYLPRSYAYLPGLATSPGNTITSYAWSLISGPNTPSYLSESTTNDTLWVNNLVSGTYTFRLTATDDESNVGYDDVVVNVNADYPCNNAVPVAYTLSTTSPNEIYMTNASAQPWKGGDTLKIPAGTYTVIQIDSFGGDPCRDIIIQPLGLVTVNGPVRFGKDAHHFTIDGRYGSVRTSIVVNGAGFAASMVSHATFRNIRIQNNTGGVGIYCKKDPVIGHPYTYGFSYTMRKIVIDSIDIFKVEGEGMYVGPTGPNGDVYNGGVIPIRLDSVTISNCTTDSTGWDGIQLSGALNGAKIFGNTVTNFGLNNISSQRAGIILGGTTSGDVYNNVVKKGTGNGIQIFGYGTINIYNNEIDDVGNTGTEQSFYGSASGSSVETVASQHLVMYNNLIKYPKSQGAMDFRDANGNGVTADVHDNYFCIDSPPGNWQTLHIKFQQGVNNVNNIISCSFPATDCNCFKGLIKF